MFGKMPDLFDRNFAVGYFLPTAVFIVASILLANAFGIPLSNVEILGEGGNDTILETSNTESLLETSAETVNSQKPYDIVSEITNVESSVETVVEKTNGSSSVATIVETTMIIIVSWLVSIILLGANRELYRILEGYGKWNPFKVLRWLEVHKYNN